MLRHFESQAGKGRAQSVPMPRPVSMRRHLAGLVACVALLAGCQVSVLQPPVPTATARLSSVDTPTLSEVGTATPMALPLAPLSTRSSTPLSAIALGGRGNP